MYIVAELKDDQNRPLGLLAAMPKEFRTGSKGFFASGKIVIEGKRYQVQVQLVEIGSKATTESTPSET